jgi:hypothetical protein
MKRLTTPQKPDNTFAYLVDQGVRAYKYANRLELLGMAVDYVAEAAAIGVSTLDAWRSKKTARVARDFRSLTRFAKVCVQAAPELGEEWVRSLFLESNMAGYGDQAIGEIFGKQEIGLSGHGDVTGELATPSREQTSNPPERNKRLTTRLNTVPCLPSHYIARATYLDGLKPRVLATRDSGGCIPIVGMTGIGKTTLMTALGHDPQIRDRFPGSVHWFQPGQEKDALAFVERIAAVLGYILPQSLRTIRGVIEAIRAHLGEKRVLLLVDDVSNLGQVEVLKELRPAIVVVFTTRRSHIAASVCGSSQDLIHVGKMTEIEAREMISAIRSVPEEQRGAAEAIARLADYHPCALATLASAARTLEMTWTDIAAALQSPSARSMLLHGDTAERHDLWTGLEADWNVLDRRYQEALQTLVRLPETTTYDVATARAAWKVDVMTATITLKTLAAMSLMVPSDSSSPGYTLHWLIRDYVRERICTTADQT